ncbi:replication/maintenance protein RepL [Myroides odoratimimus]|uniref:replication/maintenance protein RepL n=1 Tax=Myroides odoratimimus TaxID=76832 RepID=UPI0025751EFC|nr:replication/maintenance protein RepL [Myroides odoratimimus]MDM1036339.1 replication/maintenance protein RepL [Myroides odoratimimus]MDM1039869.1 replication/maintenance protein RepL [Myroides odoratimimus]MDM1054102.1 replication/maintenance protein RepL [Myroides odoratimimus]
MENEPKKKNLSVIDFEKNKENPFLKEAVEQIQQNIVKKYKNASGTSQNAILQAIDNDGQILGHTSFIRQIEVDEEQFTKVYLSQFSAFWNLKTQAIRVFGYIMTKLIPKQDMFYFFIDECMEHTGYKSEKSIYIGLASLLDCKIIARGRTDSLYFINPMIAFNGDRVTFAKTYVKKQNKEKSKLNTQDPNQINLLDQIKEFEDNER